MTSDVPVFTRLPAIGLLDGWRRNAVAFSCGALATLSLPPFFLFPLMVPSFCGLIWLINGAPSRRRAFFDGWWWGWGFYMTGLYWFCIALLTDAEKFAWLIPFALFGLTGVIALYSGVACWLITWIRVQGIARIFTFSVLWTLVEYARGHLFTGFPWNLPGYAFTVSDSALQLASLVGIYGISWAAVFLAMLPAALGDFSVESKRAVRAVGIAYILLATGVAWGAWRLQSAGEDHTVEGIHLRLVQASIAQHHKWEPALQMQGLKEHARLTQMPGIGGITHVIWPETAVPYVVKANSKLTQMLGLVIPPHAVLITGALRAEGDDIWNSVVAIDSAGSIVGTYDKAKLVPFGEFLPLRRFIPEAWATPVGNKDFSTGPGPVTLDWPGIQGVSPLICYEAIFPDHAASPERKPELLLNLTNDAWFGTSSGPYQHFHMSRVRAVEQGVPLIRVANTGISALVDAYGRVKAQLGLNEKGVLDVDLPQNRPGSTWYSVLGDKFLLILTTYAILLIIILNRKRISSNGQVNFLQY